MSTQREDRAGLVGCLFVQGMYNTYLHTYILTYVSTYVPTYVSCLAGAILLVMPCLYLSLPPVSFGICFANW